MRRQTRASWRRSAGRRRPRPPRLRFSRVMSAPGLSPQTAHRSRCAPRRGGNGGHSSREGWAAAGRYNGHPPRQRRFAYGKIIRQRIGLVLVRTQTAIDCIRVRLLRRLPAALHNAGVAIASSAPQWEKQMALARFLRPAALTKPAAGSSLQGSGKPDAHRTHSRPNSSAHDP